MIFEHKKKNLFVKKKKLPSSISCAVFFLLFFEIDFNLKFDFFFFHKCYFTFPHQNEENNQKDDLE